MKATGIIRRFDDLGRIPIPKEVRRKFNLTEGIPMEIFTDKESIILRKYEEDTSDDVCEYKYNVARSKDIYFLTSCGHRHNGRLDNSLPYCGFCGKR